MNVSVKDQVKRGLRLGGGVAVFLLALAPLIDGLRRVVWAAPQHQLLLNPIGWMELFVAAALLVSTARIWVYYLAGCMVFGVVKALVVLISGNQINEMSHLQLAELLFVTFASAVLIVGMVVRGTKLLDRIALTLYIFCVAWHANAGLFMPDESLVIGLVGLLVAWGIHYSTQSRTERHLGGWPTL
jgi:hypothetical protein